MQLGAAGSPLKGTIGFNQHRIRIYSSGNCPSTRKTTRIRLKGHTNRYKSLKEVIVKTIEMTMEFPAKKSYIGVPVPYDAFAKLLGHIRTDAFPQQTVSVITFNYDIAIDMALFREGMGPDYGISSHPRSHNPVPLFKLHGSQNWASEKNSGEVRPLHLRDYFTKYSIMGFDDISSCKIPVGSQLFEYFSKHANIEVEKEPVIVPPTWNKAEHHQLLSIVWGKAAQHLGEARTIFIIGYSLPETDAFFRLLYALGTVGLVASGKGSCLQPR